MKYAASDLWKAKMYSHFHLTSLIINISVYQFIENVKRYTFSSPRLNHTKTYASQVKSAPLFCYANSQDHYTDAHSTVLNHKRRDSWAGWFSRSHYPFSATLFDWPRRRDVFPFTWVKRTRTEFLGSDETATGFRYSVRPCCLSFS